MSEREDDYGAFEFMARCHPVETYDTWPERFWEYFQVRCPGVTRNEMMRLLKETESEIDEAIAARAAAKERGGGDE